MRKITFENLTSGETLASLISQRESFEVIGLGGKLLETVRLVENRIESADLNCRIYTSGRIGLAAGSLFGGVTGVLGALSAAGIAMHNIATFNPDYEIEKIPTHNKILVKYKKKKN
ncbi:hypothetical protein [Ectopseudomonas toyotomiensis]|uniref:Uncharacterized protein n=1 Tax=Ectopseudomonas toyotomiensis TaxID=554344 RepID=A0AA42IL90_9GAMM|nr:hypothetical protein [Pseudomonas toyotomiensis]MBG0843501.1 hypothetical protein [Pseudomonas toyotomiensis]MDH0701315.1 hypothetical protein [Pseudomonas toyotomiensis]